MNECMHLWIYIYIIYVNVFIPGIYEDIVVGYIYEGFIYVSIYIQDITYDIVDLLRNESLRFRHQRRN